MLRLAQRVHDPSGLGNSHILLGNVLFACGALAAARTHLEQGLADYPPPAPPTPGFLPASRLEVFGLSRLALVLWHLGYPDQALQRTQTALSLARALAHPVIVVAALINAAQLHWRRQEAHGTAVYAEAALGLAHAQGFASRVAEATMLRGWARVEPGQGEAGIAQIRQGLTAFRATGAESPVGYLVLLAEALRQGGQCEAGARVIGEALALGASRGEGQWAAEVVRCQGALLLTRAAAPQREAETCFQQALALARHQQARAWELRAAMSLSRLWQQQGKRQEAHDLLAPVYGWFTEGFDTADLKDAKALLHALEDGR
jgi:predicted ATPase